ncbi:TRL domain-containing protein [Leptospira dzoumogneensis]|uniref:TRL-like family protein n=1 Tax=Leptospira dzoumogneensis TaxID=2484904 RepID=A0A4Z1A9J8_9LEPT|nr:TRL domain-containing protein [Leptospira dzoumogneensis]TGM96161.1 TRL-like family protein [Leptospira dzoumogneensis]
MRLTFSSLALLLLCSCFPEYRVPYSALIISAKHTSRGESNLFYPSHPEQNANVIGQARLIKEGRSCSSSIFYLDMYVFIKGGSVRDAAESAGIKMIGAIEYSHFNILGIFIKECVIVRGE